MKTEPITIYLCSDEQGGEHEPLLVASSDLRELKRLGFRPVHDADYYEDGAETWQGPQANFAEARKISYRPIREPAE